jgi:hypothetical protein
MTHPASLQSGTGKERALRISEEIAALELRLDGMGMDGDCAYERAMSRLYISLLEDRKRQLALVLRQLADR